MTYNKIDVRNISMRTIDYESELCHDWEVAYKYIKFIYRVYFTL